MQEYIYSKFLFQVSGVENASNDTQNNAGLIQNK